MKRTLLLLVLLACLGISSYSQKANYINYYNFTNKAEYFLYTQQKTEQAKQLYLHAFSIVPEPLAKDCYMLARCYAKLGDYDSAWIFLQKATNTSIIFNAPSEIIRQDTFYFGQFLRIHPESVDKLKLMDSTYLGNFYKQTEPIRAFVDSCCIEDQKYRNSFKEANPQTKEEHLANLSILKDSDNHLQKKLIDYIYANGYPGVLACGTDNIVLVMLHMNDVNYDAIKDIVYKELKSGSIMPYEIGMIVDRNEYIDKNLCGLTPGVNCTDADWSAIINNRLKYGVSIYFSNSMRDIISKKDLMPWVGTLVEN